METTEKTFVVTAFERAKGYRIRITLPATRKHAEKVAAKLTEEMETAIAKYQFFTDIRVEHMNKYIHS